MSNKEIDEQLQRAIDGGSVAPQDLQVMINSAARKQAKSSRGRRNNKYKLDRPLTYKELRELEKQNETAFLGPGTHDDLKPFGSDVKGTPGMGSKYKFVPKEGPAPGQYDQTTGMKWTKPKNYEAFIGNDKQGDGVLLDGSKPN